jgi:hypothetical protein
MAASPIVLHRGNVTTTRTTGYTAPGGVRAILTNLVISNVTSSYAAIDLWIDGFQFYSGTPVPPNGVIALDMAQVIESGATIEAEASADSALVIHACGVEVPA